MTVGIDRLTEFVLMSLRVFLENHLVGSGGDYSGVWLAHQDFDHGKRPDGSVREVPYVAVEYDGDEALPFHIGNQKYQRNIDFRLLVVCEDYEAFLRRPQQVQQLLLTAQTSGVSGAIPLVDFDAPGEPDVGTFQVETGSIVPFLDIDSKSKWRNLKFVGMVGCRVEREKTKEAVLL